MNIKAKRQTLVKPRKRKRCAWGHPPKRHLYFLEQNLDGFRELPEDCRKAVTSIFYTNTLDPDRYAHSHFPGYFFIPYQKINEAFGSFKVFKEVNDRLELFEIIDRPNYKEGYTRSFRFTQKAEQVYMDCLRTQESEPTELINDYGSDLKLNVPAINSRDQNGNKAKHRYQIPLGVPVNHQGLKDALSLFILLRKGEGVFPRNPVEQYIIDEALKLGDIEEWCQRREIALLLLNESLKTRIGMTLYKTDPRLPQYYRESASGRLYGYGFSLQNCPREVKNVALWRMWEYDFSNCHYSFLNQLAKKHDLVLPTVNRYLKAKKRFRKRIAKESGLEIDQVKMALIALIYGARVNERQNNAIASKIGLEAFKRLCKVKAFTNLSKEVKRARRAIVGSLRRYSHNQKAVKKGYITNALGKTILKSERPKYILSHILQGLEAKALSIVIREHGSDIRLLQHDGWTQSTPITDLSQLELTISKELGFKVKIDGEVIGEEYEDIDFS